jgi:RHS repeat-associated protein
VESTSVLQTNVWFGGRLLAPHDRLSSNGKYFPYGEDRTNPSPANPSNGVEKFATYTRDSSTGLDYAYQRYYTSGLGRFLTADPLGRSASSYSPQSFNRYTYAGGDPTNSNDPTGACDPSDPNCNRFWCTDGDEDCPTLPCDGGPVTEFEPVDPTPCEGGNPSTPAGGGPKLVPTYLVLVSDQYTSYFRRGVYVATREISYIVLNQFDTQMTNVQVWEVMTIAAAGSGCPSGDTPISGLSGAGGQCIGQKEEGGFTDELAQSPFLPNGSWWQAIFAQVNGATYAVQLTIINNYTPGCPEAVPPTAAVTAANCGSPLNFVSLSAQAVSINGNLGSPYGPSRLPPPPPPILPQRPR